VSPKGRAVVPHAWAAIAIPTTRQIAGRRVEGIEIERSMRPILSCRAWCGAGLQENGQHRDASGARPRIIYFEGRAVTCSVL
jgi:hypothetical protein